MANKIKYPPKYVNRELKRLLGRAKQDDKIIFIGTLFKDKPYSKATIDVVVKRFIRKIEDKKIINKDIDYLLIKSIVQVRKKTAEVIEANIIADTSINPVFKMFLLKCCHKWIEEDKKLGLKINIKQDIRYSIESVPKLKNPVLIDGIVREAISIDKPKDDA